MSNRFRADVSTHTRRPVLARRFASFFLLVFMVATCREAVAACTAKESPIELVPGRIASVDVSPDAPLMLEEMGADIEYRRGRETAFTPIDTPPGRLGFAVLTAGATPVQLRSKADQGPGRVWISDCLTSGDAAFYAQLAQLQSTHLRAGPETARAALPLIEGLNWLPLSSAQRGRLASARANALLSAGLIDESRTAFVDAQVSWFTAGRTDRAAVSLMSQGENASRSGKFDDADHLLAGARDALLREGVTYYGLRSQAALCTVLSRRGNFKESVACESRVVDAMLLAGEDIEAATRQISLANQYMRLDDFARSRERLLAADSAAPRMSPIVRSRLESTWGSYELYSGDLPAAAARFAQASAALGGKGLADDQALIDMKLASLAALSGADVERRRLLERVAAGIDEKNNAPLLSFTHLQLARSARQTAEPLVAIAFAQSGRALCRRTGDRECEIASCGIEAQAQIDLGNLDLAEDVLAAVPASDVALTRLELALADARLQLAYRRPELALRRLPDALALADDRNAQAQYARLKAEGFAALGNRDAALTAVGEAWSTQLLETEAWPSLPLRISARNRLAGLQSSLIGLLLASTSTSVDVADYERLATVIDRGGAPRLFRRPASLELDDTLRRALSNAVLGTTSDKQRELFVALARPRAATAEEPPTEPPGAGAALTADDVVVLPLSSERELLLVAWRAGAARLCRRWPLPQYRALVARYERALDGKDEDLTSLDEAALDWKTTLDRCHPDAPPASRWNVVSIPGTRSLPWAWIAAAGTDPSGEPVVTTTFGVPRQRIANLSQPSSVTLLDLDMPNVDKLPFAQRERGVLERLMESRGMSYHRVIGADETPAGILSALSDASAVHVIGHANPAAYGQLYQGLWFESQRRPTLLTYPEIVAARSQAELVVLSACGTTVAAQAAFGATSQLAEAFIAAGARRVVAASNALSDNAAPVWARALHDSLWISGDVAAAARDARRALRDSPHFRHPRFWAGLEVFTAASPDPSAGKAVSFPWHHDQGNRMNRNSMRCPAFGAFALFAGCVAWGSTTIAKAEEPPAASLSKNTTGPKGKRKQVLIDVDTSQAEKAIEDLGFTQTLGPGPKATHCRLIPTGLGFNLAKWVRKAASQDEFLSLMGTSARQDFEIYDSWHWASGVSIKIDDRIQNKPAATGFIKLEHTRPVKPPATPPKYDPIASSSTMTQRNGGIWLQGDSTAAVGTETGTYYVFLLDDAATCTHSKPASTNCRRVHIEYFEKSLSIDRPQLNVNVFEIHEKPCQDALWQTDDGDGDEGIR